MYYPGKVGGGTYQLPPGVLVGSTSPWTQPPTLAKPPPTPYNWRPTTFVDKRHPKIQAMMEPLLIKFRGRCLVSNILTESGKQFDSLPRLKAYPNKSAGYILLQFALMAINACLRGVTSQRLPLLMPRQTRLSRPSKPASWQWYTVPGHLPPQGSASIGRGVAEGWEARAAGPRPLLRCDWGTPQSLVRGGRRTGQGTVGCGVLRGFRENVERFPGLQLPEVSRTNYSPTHTQLCGGAHVSRISGCSWNKHAMTRERSGGVRTEQKIQTSQYNNPSLMGRKNSWTFFQISYAVGTRVTSVLQMKDFTLDEWR